MDSNVDISDMKETLRLILIKSGASKERLSMSDSFIDHIYDQEIPPETDIAVSKKVFAMPHSPLLLQHRVLKLEIKARIKLILKHHCQ